MARILELPSSILSSHVLGDLTAADRKAFRNACKCARLTVNADVQLVRVFGSHIQVGGQRLTLRRLTSDFQHLKCLVLLDSPRDHICGPLLDRFLALANDLDGFEPPGATFQSLDVKQCHFLSAPDLQQLLLACPRLQRLRMPRWLERGHFNVLQSLNCRLVELDLGDASTDILSVTDKNLAFLPALPALRTFSVRRCIAVTDAGIAQLEAARLPSLTSLDLSYTRVTGNSGFAGLQLRSLSVQGCRSFAERGLAAVCIQHADSLQSLSLCGTAVQPYGKSLWHVAHATRLERLDLGPAWEVDDVGLAALSCCPLIDLRLGNFNLRSKRPTTAAASAPWATAARTPAIGIPPPPRGALSSASTSSSSSLSSSPSSSLGSAFSSGLGSPSSSFGSFSSSSGSSSFSSGSSLLGPSGGADAALPRLTQLSLGGMFAQEGLQSLLPGSLPALRRLQLTGLSTARDEVLGLLLGSGGGSSGSSGRSDSSGSGREGERGSSSGVAGTDGGSGSSSWGSRSGGGGVAASLQELRLVSSGPDLTPAGILRLAALPALRCLTLAACPSATEGTVRQLLEAVRQAGRRLQVEVLDSAAAAAGGKWSPC